MTTEEIESERALLQSEVANAYAAYEKAVLALLKFEREQRVDTALIERAKRELKSAGYYDPGLGRLGQLVVKDVVELLKVFSAQGHSGVSEIAVADAFYKLALRQPLTSMTSNRAKSEDGG